MSATITRSVTTLSADSNLTFAFVTQNPYPLSTSGWIILYIPKD